MITYYSTSFYIMSRSELKEVFLDTQKLTYSKYPYEGKYVNYVVGNNFKFPDYNKPKQFIVTKNDCIADCQDDVRNNKKVLLINSASMKRPGGGVTNGSSAQEESICRRTNLYMALDQVDDELEYPLFGKTKGIYTPQVKVFKNERNELCEPFNIDVLSVFSRPVNKIKTDSHMRKLNRDIFETILYSCNEYNIETLVIVPIGCGVFDNDPDLIASIFREYVDSTPTTTLEKIIISCYSSGKNYDAFSSHFSD